MLIHSVFFWLREDLTVQEQARFVEGLKTLQQIKHAEAVYVGTPSATAPRPVLDSSYDYGLTVLLEDVPAHDAYQADPIHAAFIEDCKPFWKKVQVYDVD